MNKPESSNTESLVQCSVCRKEVPRSAAVMPESSGYVEHFCGSDCYDQYFAEHPEKVRPTRIPQGKA